MNASEDSLRDVNKAKRRRRILLEARNLIARRGFEALNLRTLAAAAQVTVPTIYNLIGKKEDLVVALFTDALSEIEQRVSSHQKALPLAIAEAVVTESIAVFEEDENYYRAAFIAVESLDQSGTHHDMVAELYRWGETLISSGCTACRAAGLLRGRISQRLIDEQILRSYRTSCRAWAFKQISIDKFRASALAGVYISLAADAVDTFHATLTKKIAALETAAPRSVTKRVQRAKE
jgi:AcrR family transcriptional regulator